MYKFTRANEIGAEAEDGDVDLTVVVGLTIVLDSCRHIIWNGLENASIVAAVVEAVPGRTQLGKWGGEELLFADGIHTGAIVCLEEVEG